MFLLKKVLSSDFVRFEKESGPGFSPSFTSSTEKHATFTRRQNYLTRDIDLRVDSSTALLSAQNLIDFLCTDYVYVHSQELMADGDSFSRSQTAHASSIGNGDLTHKKNLMLDLALDLFFIKAILITAVHLVSVEQGKQLSVRSFGPLEQTQLIARISELGGVIQVSSHPVSSEETGSLYRDKVISRLGTLIKEYSFLSLLTRHINIPDEFLDMPVTDYLNAHFYKYQLVEDFDRFSKHETASYEIHSVDTFGLSLSFYVHPYFEDLDPSLITSMIDVIHGVENASRRLVTELPNFTETLGLSSGQNINHDALSPQMVCTVGRTSLSYGGAYAGHMGLYKDGLMQDRLSCIQDSTCVGDGVGGATGSEYIAFILSQCFSCYSGIYKQTNLTHVLRETQHIWEHSKKGLAGQTALSVSSIQKLGPLRQVTFQQIGDCNAYLVKRHVDTNEFQVLLTTKDNCFGIVDAITESLFPEQEFKEYCGKRHYMDRSFHSGSDPSQFNESYLKFTVEDGYEYMTINGSDGLFDNIEIHEQIELLKRVSEQGAPFSVARAWTSFHEVFQLRCEESVITNVRGLYTSFPLQNTDLSIHSFKRYVLAHISEESMIKVMGEMPISSDIGPISEKLTSQPSGFKRSPSLTGLSQLSGLDMPDVKKSAQPRFVDPPVEDADVGYFIGGNLGPETFRLPIIFNDVDEWISASESKITEAKDKLLGIKRTNDSGEFKTARLSNNMLLFPPKPDNYTVVFQLVL